MRGGFFRTCALAVFLPGWTVLWASWCIVAGWFSSPRMCRTGLAFWARGILLVAGVRVETHHLTMGRESETRAAFADSMNDHVPSVFVSNHQSALDIPILLTALLSTHDVRFMAKESLFKIPFLGWGMAGNGFIPIRRESARAAAETFMKITARNGAGFSYIVFPEGTRSDDGHMQEFKRGAIALVMRLKRPLVPVALIDACRANPKGQLRVRSGTVRVVIGDALPPDEAALETDDRAYREKITAQLALSIAALLPEDQKPCPASSPSI